MKKIFLILIVLFVGLSIDGKAQNTNVLPVLQHNSDAASSGTGNAYMGLSKSMFLYTDPTSFFNNESALYADYNMHLFSKIRNTSNRPLYHAFSAGYKFGSNAVFGGFRYMGMSKQQEIIGDDGFSIGKFSPKDYTIDLGYSRKLSELFSAYVSASYVHSSQGVSGETFTFSGGVYFRNKQNVIGREGAYGVGLTLRDFGKYIKYENKEYDVPSTINLGGFIELPVADAHKVNVLASGQYYVQKLYNDELVVSGGLEYSFREMLSLRAGINHGFDRSTTAYTVGAGYEMKYFTVNLAYSIAGHGLFTDVFQMGVGVRF